MNVDQRAARIDVGIDDAVSFTGAVLKWFVVLNLGIGWCLFWGNLARIHYTQGAVVPAVGTLVFFIGPVVLAVLWWAMRSVSAAGS
jgi:hypothetical protein